MMRVSNERNQMKKHVVVNGLQEVEFTGTRLSRASTERDDSLRWTEVEIYKTEAGNYVIVTRGVTLVYHAVDGCKPKSQWVRVTGRSLSVDSSPCEVCNPIDPGVEGDEDFQPEAEFLHEKTHSAVEVVDQASKVQQALTKYDHRREVEILSTVAREALNKAAANDPLLLNQVLTRVHIP